MAEIILAFRVSTYARNIYMTGTERLTGIPESYRSPAMGYAAKNYYIDTLDNALHKSWLTPEEYDQTLALKTEDDPLYRPATT